LLQRETHVRGSLVRFRSEINRLVWWLSLFTIGPVLALVEFLSPHRSYGRRIVVGGMPLFFRLLGVRVIVEGTPAPRSRCVYVCNHRSNFDHFALVVAFGNLSFLAGQWLFDVPMIARTLRMLGAVPVDPTDVRATMATLTELAHSPVGRSVAVFPEGQRTGGDRLLPFQTGAFFLAIEAGIPVVPVMIDGIDAIVEPASRRRIPVDRLRSGTITIRVLDPVATTGLDVTDRRRLRDRVQLLMEEANGQHDSRRTGALAGLLGSTAHT
jgi:1-acyl-sn-glycerol-3-phosphate acyltransferase